MMLQDNAGHLIGLPLERVTSNITMTACAAATQGSVLDHQICYLDTGVSRASDSLARRSAHRLLAHSLL